MGGKRKLRVWLKIEWERMLKSRLVYISLLIGFVIAIIQIIGEVYPRAVNPLKYYSGKVGEPFSLYMFSMSMNTGSLYKEIFITIFPVLAMLPHALSYHMDVKSGYIKNVYIKTKKINYLIAKYIVTFVSAGITVIVPYIFNLIIAACMLPALNPIRNGQYISGGAMLQELYYSKPLVYIFIYLIINFLYAGAFATTALAASYYVDNIFMLSMVPFVLWYGINVISQYTVKTYHYNISPMKLVDIAQGYIVRPVPVISVLVVVALLSAVVYFLNGVKSDVY